jgi:hypothetical protein
MLVTSARRKKREEKGKKFAGGVLHYAAKINDKRHLGITGAQCRGHVQAIPRPRQHVFTPWLRRTIDDILQRKEVDHGLGGYAKIILHVL